MLPAMSINGSTRLSSKHQTWAPSVMMFFLPHSTSMVVSLEHKLARQEGGLDDEIVPVVREIKDPKTIEVKSVTMTKYKVPG